MEIELMATAGVWLVLQILALSKFAGWWRIAAVIPAALMGLALGVAAFGILAGSNLAPIWVIFALPVCTVWITGLWLVHVAMRVLAR